MSAAVMRVDERGYDLLSSIHPDVREIYREALDQGGQLVQRDGNHPLRLLLPNGTGLPVGTHSSSGSVSWRKPLKLAGDLRRAGLVIGGRAAANGSAEAAVDRGYALLPSVHREIRSVVREALDQGGVRLIRSGGGRHQLHLRFDDGTMSPVVANGGASLNWRNRDNMTSELRGHGFTIAGRSRSDTGDTDEDETMTAQSGPSTSQPPEKPRWGAIGHGHRQDFHQRATLVYGYLHALLRHEGRDDFTVIDLRDVEPAGKSPRGFLATMEDHGYIEQTGRQQRPPGATAGRPPIWFRLVDPSQVAIKAAEQKAAKAEPTPTPAPAPEAPPMQTGYLSETTDKTASLGTAQRAVLEMVRRINYETNSKTIAKEVAIRLRVAINNTAALLQQLHGKGLLERSKSGNNFLYWVPEWTREARPKETPAAAPEAPQETTEPISAAATPSIPALPVQALSAGVSAIQGLSQSEGVRQRVYGHVSAALLELSLAFEELAKG